VRILHIWDQAGVACILAKYQRLQSHETKVILIGAPDKYGIYKFYEEYISNSKLEELVEKCLEESELADVIHIHSRVDILLKVRRKFGRSKKIILHYHGTDIRRLYGRENQVPCRLHLSNIVLNSRTMAKVLRKKQFHIRAQRLADVVIVSTPDLLPLVSNAIYLPNPIDTDHFTADKFFSKPRGARALTMDTEAIDIGFSLNYCKQHNVNQEIDVYNRIKDPIMYKDMPAFLNKYGLYVDVRYVDGNILENLSKTALEALGCGLQVLDYQLKYHCGLPIEHYPINVISRLSSIYSNKRRLSIHFWYFLNFLSLVEDNFWDFLVLIRKSLSRIKQISVQE